MNGWSPVLTALLGGLVDNVLGLLGIRIGQAVFTVEGITQACAATLQLVKDLQPTSDTGRFNLSITYNGSTVGSASNVGNNGATAAVITVPGAATHWPKRRRPAPRSRAMRARGSAPTRTTPWCPLAAAAVSRCRRPR